MFEIPSEHEPRWRIARQQDARSEDHHGDPADPGSTFRFGLPGALCHASRSLE